MDVFDLSCLQAQLALMEVQWPDGLYEDTSQHQQQQQQQQQDKGLRAWSKGRGKCKAGVLQHARVVCSVGHLLIMPLGGGG